MRVDERVRIECRCPLLLQPCLGILHPALKVDAAITFVEVFLQGASR
jgi:hypothetical protein